MAVNPAAQSVRPRRRGWRPDEIADSFLLEDEAVILNEHQSLRAFILGQLPIVLGGSLLVVLISSLLGSAFAWLAVICWLLLIGFVVARSFEASYTRYVLTDMRVLRVSGLMNRSVEFIPWQKVTDVSRNESVFQWMVGSATIRIESANERSAFRVMTDVHRPERFYGALVQLVAQYHKRRDTTSIDLDELES